MQIARRTAELTAVTLHPLPCSDTCHLKVRAIVVRPSLTWWQVPPKEYRGIMPEIKAELLRRAVIVFAKHYCRIRKCVTPSLTCAEVCVILEMAKKNR